MSPSKQIHRAYKANDNRNSTFDIKMWNNITCYSYYVHTENCYFTVVTYDSYSSDPHAVHDAKNIKITRGGRISRSTISCWRPSHWDPINLIGYFVAVHNPLLTPKLTPSLISNPRGITHLRVIH